MNASSAFNTTPWTCCSPYFAENNLRADVQPLLSTGNGDLSLYMAKKYRCIWNNSEEDLIAKSNTGLEKSYVSRTNFRSQ